MQEHLPILIGGGGEKVTLRIAAKWADEWNTWGSPEVLQAKGAVLDRHCQAIGRDPATVARFGPGHRAPRRPGHVRLEDAERRGEHGRDAGHVRAGTNNPVSASSSSRTGTLAQDQSARPHGPLPHRGGGTVQALMGLSP